MLRGIKLERLTCLSPFPYGIKVPARVQGIENRKVDLPFRVPGKGHGRDIARAHERLPD